MAYYKGDMAGAEKMFKDVVAKNPKAYLSLTGLGTVAMKKKDYAAAASNLSQSFKLNPYQALASYTTNADTLINAGQFKEAKEMLLMGEYAYPYSADLYYLISRASNGLNDEKVALSSLTYAASLAPFYIDPVFDKIKLTGKAKQTALLSMAWSLYYGGSAAAAIKRFDQYAQAGGTEISGHLGTGWSQLALKKDPEATKAFEAAGDNADALAGLGWVAIAKNDSAGAEKFFNASIKKVPFYASASSGLATLQFGKTALVKAGWEAYFKGDLKGALAAFKAKESEASSANNPAALDGMGWTQLAMGEPKAANASFAAALKIDANYYSAQSGVIAAKRADLVIYNNAWAKLEAGQFDEAKAKFEQARADAAMREFVGQAGGNAVAIRITGGLQVLDVSISPEAVDPADVAMLEDLVLAAFHDALAQIDAMQHEVLGPFQNAGMPDLGDLGGLADLESLGLFGAADDIIEIDSPDSGDHA
jgi:DNA-binding YbaB/EbfC family protein